VFAMITGWGFNRGAVPKISGQVILKGKILEKIGLRNGFKRTFRRYRGSLWTVLEGGRRRGGYSSRRFDEERTPKRRATNSSG